MNEWLRAETDDVLQLLPDDFPLGKKSFDDGVYLGAFNYLPIESFIARFRAAAWEAPEQAQLFLRDEEDDRFEVYLASVELGRRSRRAGATGPDDDL